MSWDPADWSRQRFDHTRTLLGIDLDQFKRINDTHEHGVGDEGLIENEAEALSVTVSLGVAAWQASIADLDELQTNTDTALYKAKSARRNQVCLASTAS